MEPFTMFSELKIKSCNSRGDLEAVGNIELNSSSMILCPQHYFFFFCMVVLHIAPFFICYLCIYIFYTFPQNRIRGLMKWIGMTSGVHRVGV